MAFRLHFHIAFVRSIIHHAESQGVSAERLISASGLAPELLADPDAVVDKQLMAAVWQRAVAETGDSCFGLHLGERIQPADIGIVGLAMMSSPTLRSALEKLIRYWGILSNASSIRLSQEHRTTSLTLEIAAVPGNFLRENRHPAESSFSACLSILSALIGQPLRPQEASLAYPAPADWRPYERIFGLRPRFGASSNTLSFSTDLLSHPVRHANPDVAEALNQLMEQRLPPDIRTFAGQVRQQIARQMRGEPPELEAIAAALGLTGRSLQRHLQLEGTTFRRILDDFRKTLAAEYLEDRRHSIADVSFLLGFAEPAVFHRSFRAWYGITPSEHRRSLSPPA